MFLTYKGETFFEHTVRIIKNCRFYDRVVVARDLELIKISRRMGVKTVRNFKAYLGQSESIKIGIDSVQKSQGYMFFTVDQPFINENMVNTIIHKFKCNADCITVPQFENRSGSPVIFPSRFVHDLKGLTGDCGGRSLIKKYKDSIVYVNVREGNLLEDIDTLEDYRRLIYIRK